MGCDSLQRSPRRELAGDQWTSSSLSPETARSPCPVCTRGCHLCTCPPTPRLLDGLAIAVLTRGGSSWGGRVRARRRPNPSALAFLAAPGLALSSPPPAIRLLRVMVCGVACGHRAQVGSRPTASGWLARLLGPRGSGKPWLSGRGLVKGVLRAGGTFTSPEHSSRCGCPRLLGEAQAEPRRVPPEQRPPQSRGHPRAEAAPEPGVPGAPCAVGPKPTLHEWTRCWPPRWAVGVTCGHLLDVPGREPGVPTPSAKPPSLEVTATIKAVHAPVSLMWLGTDPLLPRIDATRVTEEHPADPASALSRQRPPARVSLWWPPSPEPAASSQAAQTP